MNVPRKRSAKKKTTAKPPVLTTFVGDHRRKVRVMSAATRTAAGREFHHTLPAEDQNRERPEGAARYVAPLCWCPEQEVLWFWVFRKHPPRLLHPAKVPKKAWTGIASEVAPAEVDRTLPCSKGKGPATITAAEFEKRRGLKK